ncbi:MAG: hypothetical protein DSY59_05055 [Persephonella sp.]|nr:MAG: hypothetical protein DSY59_05055 [Persephonella sp.]
MEFNLKIKNFGNIEYADINIKPFTLITGKNATGKTFITKGLYCILETFLMDLEILKKNEIDKTRKEIKEYISSRKSLFSILGENEYEEFNTKKELLENFLKFIDKFHNYDEKKQIKELKKYIYREEKKGLIVKNNLKKEILNLLITLIEKFSLQLLYWIIFSLKDLLKKLFKSNFLVGNISDLINEDKKEAIINLLDINISIKDNDEIEINGNPEIIKALFKNVIYLDSPIYIRLKDSIKQDDEYTPEYIKKFFQYLKRRFNTEDNEEKKEILNFIRNLTNGSITTDDFGNLMFKEEKSKKRFIPLSLTAMGITNLSIIEWLLRYDYITRGSVLLIDEPEVHLHPEWQVKLTYVLYKLAKYGVNVIIATHSIDIIKAVEVLLKEDKEAKNYIAVNKMPYTEDFNKKSLIEKVEESLKELIEPYSNLAWRLLDE